MYTNTDLICRACESTENLNSIFNDEIERNQYPLKISTLTNIQLYENDGMPQYICLKCIEDLNTAFKFKKRFEDLDFKFRQQLFVKEEIIIIKAENTDPLDILNGTTEPAEEFSNISEMDDQSIIQAMNIHHGNDGDIPDEQPIVTPVDVVYECTGCTEMFESYLNMIEHRKQHGDKAFVCKICNIFFQNSSILKSHMDSHKNVEDGYSSCSICSKEYASQTDLLQHMRWHCGEKEHFKCDLCPKSFYQQSTLENHRLIHLEAKDFTCQECNKEFKSLLNLKKHKLLHQETDPEIQCSSCPKQYRSDRLLRQHVRRHHRKDVPEEVVCEQCHKVFQSRSLLTSHMRTHSELRPYGCTVCGKRFQNKNNCSLHMNIHTGERPYICQLCGKGYIQPAHLRAHTMSHMEARPYTCSICDKRFASKQTLLIHIRYHTGERPFTCVVCGKGFADSNVMKKHIRRIHQNIPFQKSEFPGWK